ncbi:MAG TPA: 16S rRNA (cytosine(1402)-N(4))-methyltransferase RsmH [bacterium]
MPTLALPPIPARAGGHEPVLLNEVLSFVPSSAKLLVDVTAGRGGHARALLDAAPQAELLALDRDPDAVTAVREAFASYGARALVKQAAFSELPHHVLAASVDFLLADLGMSSPQLNEPDRGFSFTHDGPLDMRMDPTGGSTAADVVNHARPDALLALLREYGEEPFAPRIVKAIVAEREKAPILRTGQLAKIVANAVPTKFHRRGYHPATQVFQALRIEVNDELGELDRLLTTALDVLSPGGRIAVIAFHSLEDRRVKEAFRTWENPCTCPPELPRCICGKQPLGQRVTKRPVTASEDEARRNPRSRSAKLRVFEKR